MTERKRAVTGDKIGMFDRLPLGPAFADDFRGSGKLHTHCRETIRDQQARIAQLERAVHEIWEVSNTEVHRQRGTHEHSVGFYRHKALDYIRVRARMAEEGIEP